MKKRPIKNSWNGKPSKETVNEGTRLEFQFECSIPSTNLLSLAAQRELCSQVDFWDEKATICSLYPGATQLPSVSWTEVHQRPAVKRQQDGQLPWISEASLASWHLAALPLPQVNCWEPPTWKLLILPTSAAALLSLCHFNSYLLTLWKWNEVSHTPGSTHQTT